MENLMSAPPIVTLIIVAFFGLNFVFRFTHYKVVISHFHKKLFVVAWITYIAMCVVFALYYNFVMTKFILLGVIGGISVAMLVSFKRSMKANVFLWAVFVGICLLIYF